MPCAPIIIGKKFQSNPEPEIKRPDKPVPLVFTYPKVGIYVWSSPMDDDLELPNFPVLFVHRAFIYVSNVYVDGKLKSTATFDVKYSPNFSKHH